MSIEFVSYDGCYPSLCSGDVVLRVNGEIRNLGRILRPGGGTNWREDVVEHGPWYVDEWPEDFDRGMQLEALEVINGNVPLGCCGGCL